MLQRSPVADALSCLQLYTSGSTGKPKGVQHTTGGYMVGAALTTKYVFDAQPEDVYWCTADCGWITGHSYVTYGMVVVSIRAWLRRSTSLHSQPAEALHLARLAHGLKAFSPFLHHKSFLWLNSPMYITGDVFGMLGQLGRRCAGDLSISPKIVVMQVHCC